MMETGVTTFFIRHEIDTGSIIFQEKVPIAEDDTAGTLHDKLSVIGAQLMLKTVNAIAAGNHPTVPQPQDAADLKKAPKIFKETCAINWNSTTTDIVNFVRGLNPYPSAWTMFNGRTYKVHRVGIVERPDDTRKPGHYETDGQSFLHVRTSDGWIDVLELQAEGKKRMATPDYLRGNTL